MHHRIDLPPDLEPHFATHEAAALGVGRGRYNARDLNRPFHGTRSVCAPTDAIAAVRAYAPRLRPGQLIGGVSALRCWGMPVGRDWHPGEKVVIVVNSKNTPPRTRGVIGRRLRADKVHPRRVDGVPIADPLSALFMHARHLDPLEALVLLDAMLTRSSNYPGLHPARPILTRTEIEQRLDAWGRFPGCTAIRTMLPLARQGVESPKETETRAAIVAAGLPEPVVQHEVWNHGRFVARVDLAYPELKIAIEYEGDGHRTDKKQWRNDIRRQQELEAMGWTVIRITELDLQDGARALIDALRRVGVTA